MAVLGGDWTPFVSGGGIGVLLGGAGVAIRRGSHLKRVMDVLTGVPASPGVPAQPSMIERLEQVAERLDAQDGRLDEFGKKVNAVERAQSTAESGMARWSEGYDRRLSAALSRIRRAERTLKISEA